MSMEAMRAFYRLSVMVGTLVVLGLAYAAYGPPIEELGPLCERAGDMVAEAIAEWQQETPPTDTERLALTPVDPATTEPTGMAPASNSLGHSRGHAAGDMGLANYESPIDQPLQASPISENWPAAAAPSIATVAERNPLPASDRIKQMVDELNGLGMGWHKLHRWGQAGELYRFSCRVSYPGQAVMQQHFEAVAAEPAAAVANVLSQVRAER